MKLSELKTGEQGVIVKVLGHGGFRKRIIEMGFIKGQTVEVLQNAPLQDPVKYRLMGYEVSLRHQEAAQVEVVSVSEAHEMEQQVLLQGHEEDYLQHRALQQRRTIHVALVGNPNCGKTSLFNFASGAHAHVGNYSGVTVDATEAHAQMFGYEFLLTDLPGTYSLSCYSPEELYVRKHLSEQMPDVVINVVDASNLERNLYLTTQLVDMNVRMVCALNMYDEFERRGDKLDIPTLSSLFGMPMIPTSFKTGRGLKELFRAVIQVYEGKQGTSRHLHINYGHEIEQGISHIQQYLKADEHIRQRYSTRYLAIKLLEHDSDVLQYIGQHLAEEHRPEDRKQLLQARDVAAARVQEETGSDSETAIMDAKYGFINGALKEAGYVTGTKEDTYRTTHRIDHILSHKVWGFPVFFAILFIMFQTTFMLGQYPMDWIDAGVEWLGEWIGTTMEDGPLRSMLVDGVIGGVGSVIVFLPQILILYCFISIMEDSGYMARAAFIMDKLMHKMGLHGKSFIPLVMGFGCNVPAVMATRTIESRRSRLITMMILPLMSCSARLPIYIMIIGTFFAVEYQSWIMISLYAIGILLSVVVSKVFSSFIIKGDDTPFVMELPPYRFPTLKAVVRHTWEKGKEYLKKMGGIILVASILVWAMGYFSFTGVAESMETSIIGRMGQAVAPVFAPQGFNWQLDVSLITGVGAKEIVASSIGVLGGLESLTPLQAYCYLLFVLIYFPCIATVVAIKNETGSWRWACVSAVYTTCLAWVVSAVVYQIGSLLC
ncbi:ferrous iron transport protein B [uncultured Prevotella sp.]|uniref:ferrous iron transport protein B n=3 Tax=uncultured Prevotella sp. TaxID=159272 RepID=UPI002590742B|nr:ferrous iron transport protein B [uncultured Prevotella sp.]